jgi:hypothetical protein
MGYFTLTPYFSDFCVVAEAEESACTRTVRFVMSHPVSFKPSASGRAILAMGAANLVATSLRPARANPIGGTD